MTILRPNDYLTSVVQIDYRELLAAGISLMMLDLDNTLLPRSTYTVPSEIVAYLNDARAAGMRCCIVSNNWHQRCHDIALALRMPIVTRAMKPLPCAIRYVMREMDVRCEECVLVGDQLFTDVLGAHLGGIRAILVKPLAEQDLAHTLLLRRVSKLLLGNLQPRR